jgi:cobalt-zinc-cadmium efflux system membrane fusion protein
MLGGLVDQTESTQPAVVVDSASLRLAGRAKAPVTTWAVVALGLLFVAGCNDGKGDPKAEAPPPTSVESDMDANNFKVDHPEQFPLVTAVEHKAAPTLNVTGLVQPDINRTVPVISLAAGRVVEVKAKLGDVVQKGQLLLRVQSNDVSGAYQTYLKAQNDERLGAGTT